MTWKRGLPTVLLLGFVVFFISLRTGNLLGHDLTQYIVHAYEGKQYALARGMAYLPAFAGNAKAERILGMLYLPGRGGPRDFNRAFRWISRAALQGDVEAETELANLYAFGLGRPSDYGKALELYGKAAAQGWPPAQLGLGLLYREGWGVPQDYRKTVEWFQRAAGSGWKPSMTSLGTMYERGWGAPQDYAEAYKWYSLSEEGYKIAPASSNAQRLRQRLTFAQFAEAQKRIAAYKAAHPAR